MVVVPAFGAAAPRSSRSLFLRGRRGRRVATGVEDVVFYVADVAAVLFREKLKVFNLFLKSTAATSAT